MALIYRYLDTLGTGLGTKNFNGNYSSVQGVAKITPPAGRRYNLNRLIVSCEDTSGMQANEYGNLGSALANGIEMKVTDPGGVILDITDGLPITTNAEWGKLCYDVEVKAWGTTPTNQLLLVRFTFSKSGDDLTLSDENSLEVYFDDDLRGLINHHFMVQGNG